MAKNYKEKYRGKKEKLLLIGDDLKVWTVELRGEVFHEENETIISNTELTKSAGLQFICGWKNVPPEIS